MPRQIAVAVALTFTACTTGHVTVTYHEESEHARIGLARELERRLTRTLPPLLKSFAVGRRALLDARTKTYPAAGVQALLTSTEDTLQAQLDQPEFAPVRDKVASVFLVVRQGLGLTEEAHAGHPTVSRVVMAIASKPAGATDRLNQRATESAFDAVRDFLQQMLKHARLQESLVNLCVVSRPQAGAVFSMNAPSYPEQVYTRRTPSQLLNIFRGIYAYTVQIGEKMPIKCQPRPGKKPLPCTLDLWQFSSPTWPTFDCDLEFGNCSLKEDWPSSPDCPSIGR